MPRSEMPCTETGLTQGAADKLDGWKCILMMITVVAVVVVSLE